MQGQPIPATEAEIRPFASAIAMLRPFVPQILGMLQHETDDARVAEDLAAFVPGPLAGTVANFAQLTMQRGPAILGLLDPALQTERAARVFTLIHAHLTGD